VRTNLTIREGNGKLVQGPEKGKGDISVLNKNRSYWKIKTTGEIRQSFVE
jgi:hypothetical protein